MKYTTTIYYRFDKCSKEKTRFICRCSSATARAYLGDRRHCGPRQHRRRRPRRCLHRQTSREQVNDTHLTLLKDFLRITPSCNNNNSDFVCTIILENQAQCGDKTNYCIIARIVDGWMKGFCKKIRGMRVKEWRTTAKYRRNWRLMIENIERE